MIKLPSFNVAIATANGNVTITAAGGNTWTFGTNGTTTFPTGGLISNYPGGTGANNDSWFLTPGNGTGGVSSQDGQQYIQINNNLFVEIGTSFGTANASAWKFGQNGTTIFPTLTVTRGDRSGTLTGQALLFGDSTQEALISTPNGTSDINASQRLVINPGAGYANTTGEGGDIYLYAGRGGDAGGSGGDIKIRGGLGPVNGAGGYLDLQGGEADADGEGGRIDIRGGYSGNAVGGNINIDGGQGQTLGGVVNINGGYGSTGQGGNINIAGGQSGNGLGNYGNVSIGAGASTWQFDNTGNLALPRGGVVYETSIPGAALTGNTIALKPQGGTNADQQLLIYPTAIPGTDNNHLHLTTGNLYNTELFLGNDDLYVKLANTGNIVINSNNGVGNSAQWTFGTAGTILNSGNLILQTLNGVPGAVTAITGSSGFWESNPRNNLATTGGTGTGLTVNVTDDGGYASAIAIATPGTGYSNGDSISVVSGSSDASFTISVLANGWTFGTSGNLTLPGNTFAVNYANGTAVSLGGNYGNANVADFLDSLGSNAIVTTGNITGGNIITANAASVILGNAVSSIKQNGSNATVNLSGSVTLSPDTAASANNGVVIGGNGYLLAPNGSRNAVLNYSGASGTMGIYSVNVYGNTATAIENGGANGVGNIGANASNRFNTVFATAGDFSGNVTASNFVGNISITGNVTGTSPNVTLVAGSFSTVFDNTGVATFPGNISADNISAGNIGVSETVTARTLVTDPGPLSGLTATFGARAFINDGNLAAAGNFGAQVSGGAGNSVPVWSDGTNWYIG